MISTVLTHLLAFGLGVLATVLVYRKNKAKFDAAATKVGAAADAAVAKVEAQVK